MFPHSLKPRKYFHKITFPFFWPYLNPHYKNLPINTLNVVNNYVVFLQVRRVSSWIILCGNVALFTCIMYNHIVNISHVNHVENFKGNIQKFILHIKSMNQQWGYAVKRDYILYLPSMARERGIKYVNKIISNLLKILYCLIISPRIHWSKSGSDN